MFRPLVASVKTGMRFLTTDIDQKLIDSLQKLSKPSSFTFNASDLDLSLFGKQPRKAFNIKQNDLMVASPKAVAQNMKLSGPAAGRTVEVFGGNLHAALMSLNRVCNMNNIRGQSMNQRFHIRPTKYKQERKLVAKKKTFDKGITRLMTMVHEAKRRGY